MRYLIILLICGFANAQYPTLTVSGTTYVVSGSEWLTIANSYTEGVNSVEGWHFSGTWERRGGNNGYWTSPSYLAVEVWGTTQEATTWGYTLYHYDESTQQGNPADRITSLPTSVITLQQIIDWLKINEHVLERD